VVARFDTAIIVFLCTLALTFSAAIIARIRSRRADSDEDLAGRKLNRWLIGLSAGTTGNSGFIVTGAVGLGYVGGAHWMMLALSWMLGDLVYWSLFPQRLNRTARVSRAVTLSEMLTFDLNGRMARAISIVVALVLIVFLSTYTAAQWLAGKKFLSGISEFSDFSALTLFAGTIVLYSAVGGFRGSVYTDFVQAIIRIIGTLIALGVVTWHALADTTLFSHNIAAAGPDFLRFFPGFAPANIAGFVLGYAAAAVGFGLGQPQIVSRYMAGSSPEETKRAMWIYIGFLQFTWIAMTGFGMLLRGVMPGIADPETGLSLFFQRDVAPVATGIIFADVFATIASTANGILVVTSQTLLRDLLPFNRQNGSLSRTRTTVATLMLGLATMLLSMVLPGNVFTIALGSVSQIAAGLAGAVMIKVCGWKHTAFSLFAAILSGVAVALAWSYLGYSATVNEAGVGIVASLFVNWVLAPVGSKAKTARLA
jgi:sodium/proline symporter